MIIGKKALIGFLGLGTAAAALGWMLLPENSKVKKVIRGKAKEMGSIFKNHIDDVLKAVDVKDVAAAIKKS
jgi:hypothetical protein